MGRYLQMITTDDLDGIARGRLEDAQALLDAARYDGAAYLCGYAVEVALKARICGTLAWKGYPYTSGEFTGYASFRTHDLDVLLHLSGVEDRIRSDLLVEWSQVAAWDPSARYRPLGEIRPEDAQQMVSAARKLLQELL